jgi:putative endonuclease
MPKRLHPERVEGCTGALQCHGRYHPMSWPAGVRATQLKAVALSKNYFVYILASERNGTLYIGVTNNLIRRVSEHREGMVAGFTRKYGVSRLVYFEVFDCIEAALFRETRLKKYKREWKINLIQSRNVEWNDLYETLNS